VARVTQRVPVEALDELVRRPPRAALALAVGGAVAAAPVALVRDGDALRVGIDAAVLPGDPLPERAVLLVDDGRAWFELRAITWRGTLAGERHEAPDGLVWLTFEPTRVVAWDYGALHEEPDP
jgi:hypothetical protein